MTPYQKSHRPTTPSLAPRSSAGKGRLIALLRQAGLTARARRVARCATAFRAYRCEHRHLARAIPGAWCHYRLCPACARWRQARAVARLLPALWALQRRYPRARWVLITLTVLSTHEPLKTIVSRVQGRFAKLRRSKDWNGHILGGVGSMEITYHAGTGWHVHLHVLVACQERWAQADLAVAWRRASEGAGRVVDIRDRNQDIRSGRGAALCSLFKPPTLRGWGPAQVAEFDALARFKLGECYGALRGLRGALGKDGAESRAGAREAPRPKVGAPCPACGRPLAWARASQAEVQAMMWVTARPISLTRMLPGTMPSLDQGLVRASGN